MEEKDQFERLYQLYLKNQCTAKELKQFFQMLDDSKNDEAVNSLMSMTWDQTAVVPEKGLTPTFLDEETKHVNLNPLKRSYFSLQQIIGIAALLIMITGLFFYQSELANLVRPVAKLELFSATSERKQLQLADGTKVWLSPNSTLTYPNKFTGKERLVQLDGEAFFEVTHDTQHPFIIKSGNLSTTVLGTSFNITAYAQQHTINVTLVTGKVAVALSGQTNTQRDTILANQRIIVDKASSVITKVDYPDAAAFLNKRLGLYEYKGAALQEVGNDLENQYNIKIQFDQDLHTRSFYGNLKMTDSLVETLNKLCTVMETKWKKDGGQYVIIK